MVELRAVSTPYGPSLEYRVTHQQQRATKQDKPGRKLYQQFAQSSSMSGMLSVGANVTLEKAVIMTQDGNLVISIPKRRDMLSARGTICARAFLILDHVVHSFTPAPGSKPITMHCATISTSFITLVATTHHRRCQREWLRSRHAQRGTRMRHP